jgi:hypothetical protein
MNAAAPCMLWQAIWDKPIFVFQGRRSCVRTTVKSISSRRTLEEFLFAVFPEPLEAKLATLRFPIWIIVYYHFTIL